jgi:hypothetical protein
VSGNGYSVISNRKSEIGNWKSEIVEFDMVAGFDAMWDFLCGLLWLCGEEKLEVRRRKLVIGNRRSEIGNIWLEFGLGNFNKTLCWLSLH